MYRGEGQLFATRLATLLLGSAPPGKGQLFWDLPPYVQLPKSTKMAIPKVDVALRHHVQRSLERHSALSPRSIVKGGKGKGARQPHGLEYGVPWPKFRVQKTGVPLQREG